MSKITLILGGASSGKSTFGEELANTHTKKLYLATAEISDDTEMQARIKAHKQRRDESWQTQEVPLGIANEIKKQTGEYTVILVDCLTLWLSNLIFAGFSPEAETEKLISAIENPAGDIIFISNEVGLSIVPENKLAREFRDEQGILNQKLAKRADNVVFISAGIPLYLKEASNGS